MLARSHVGWGLAASLLLHVTGIAALTLALPRLDVRPGIIRRVEFSVVQEPPPTAASTRPAPPLPAADPSPPAAEPSPTAAPSPQPTAADADDGLAVPTQLPPPAAAPKPAPRRKPQPKPVATPEPKLQSPAHADPSSDGSALERVLRQIAATTELTQDERRRAMLVVLRTWEDPSGKHSADELIEALLKNVRQARTNPPPEAPGEQPRAPQP